MKYVCALMSVCLVFLSGCVGGTKVTKDGFLARQVTNEENYNPMTPTNQWKTTCPWKERQYDKEDNAWYCPPEYSMMEQTTVTKPTAELVAQTASNVVPFLFFLQMAKQQRMTGVDQYFDVSTFNTGVNYVPLRSAK